MICTYNSIQQTWLTEDGRPVQMPCYGLAICEGHLYARIEVPGRTRSYTLEPCTSQGLFNLMTEDLPPIVAPADYGYWSDAVEGVEQFVHCWVDYHREDLNVDLSIIDDLRNTDVGTVYYVLGLRQHGVDGLSFIRCRSLQEYRRIVLIQINTDGHTIIHNML